MLLLIGLGQEISLQIRPITRTRRNSMKSVVLAIGLLIAMPFGAFAQGSAPAVAGQCDAQAAAKNLRGAAKTSFVTKCKRDACEPKAMSKEGKPLSGAAKNSFMKSCERGA
jgi:hypothetical protein